MSRNGLRGGLSPAHPVAPPVSPPPPGQGTQLIPYHKRGVTHACPLFHPDTLDKIPQLRLTGADIVVAAYPKAGTTWMQQIVYLVCCDGDAKYTNHTALGDRYVFLEFGIPGRKAEMERLKDMPHPWFIKTHMPYQMMENQVNRDKAKHIVVMRNPKDNFVSMYYFYKISRALGFYKGTWDEYFEEYIRPDKVASGCPLRFNKSWWENRHNENVLICFYEDMKRDLRAHVEKVASFLGKDLTAAQIDTITEATTFSSMKKNPSTNYSIPGENGKSISGKTDQGSSLPREGINGEFMRKGEVGDWRNHFNTEQDEFVDKLIAKELGSTDLKFLYDS